MEFPHTKTTTKEEEEEAIIKPVLKCEMCYYAQE